MINEAAKAQRGIPQWNGQRDASGQPTSGLPPFTPFPPPPQEYVCGFLFWPRPSHDPNELNRWNVALIRKNKPEWQKGLLNGVGGKVEPGEKPLEAMIREFEEEAGRPTNGWKHFITLSFKKAVVHFFYMKYSQDIGELKSCTSEDIEVWSVASALRTTGKIPNLNWLIPMAFFDSDYSPIPILIYDYL